MGGGVAADEVRGAGADAPARRGAGGGFGQRGLGGEAQIIVGAESEHRRAAVGKAGLGPAWRSHNAAAAGEAGGVEIGEAGVEFV